jgi:hypothetical protein
LYTASVRWAIELISTSPHYFNSFSSDLFQLRCTCPRCLPGLGRALAALPYNPADVWAEIIEEKKP